MSLCGHGTEGWGTVCCTLPANFPPLNPSAPGASKLTRPAIADRLQARALNPGLVYDSQPRNWDIYTCAASPFARSAACKALCKPAKLCSRPQALRDFNTPSFSFPNLTCTQRRVKVTAKRTVAFAGTGAATFSAKFSLPPLFTASVKVAKVGRGKAAAQTSKTQLQVKAAGDKRDFTVTLVAGPKAPLGWSFGSLVWTDSGGVYTVRTPIAIQCV
jgi:hypothetical protein